MVFGTNQHILQKRHQPVDRKYRERRWTSSAKKDGRFSLAFLSDSLWVPSAKVKCKENTRLFPGAVVCITGTQYMEALHQKKKAKRNSCKGKANRTWKKSKTNLGKLAKLLRANLSTSIGWLIHQISVHIHESILCFFEPLQNFDAISATSNSSVTIQNHKISLGQFKHLSPYITSTGNALSKYNFAKSRKDNWDYGKYHRRGVSLWQNIFAQTRTAA